MAKSIKYINNKYMDTSGIVHNRELLNDMINNNFVVGNISSKNKFRIIDSVLSRSNITVTAQNGKFKISRTANNTGDYPSFVYYADGTTYTGQYWLQTGTANKGSFTELGKTYTLSVNFKSTSNFPNRILVGYDDGTASSYYLAPDVNYLQQTFKNITKNINFIELGFYPNELYNEEVEIQLEEGEKATQFTPYLDVPLKVEDVSSYFTLTDTINFTETTKKIMKYGKVVNVYIELKPKTNLSAGPTNYDIYNVNHAIIGSYAKHLNSIIQNSGYVPQNNSALVFLRVDNDVLRVRFNNAVPSNYSIAIYGTYVIS